MTWGGPQLPSGIDQFTSKQQPAVEPCDDLSGFVMLRILETETEPRVDGVPKLHHATNGAMAHRYASKVRADMVAFRRVVRQYVDYAESSWPHDQVLLEATTLAVKALAMRWDDHPGFREEWRL